MATTVSDPKTFDATAPWHGFQKGLWQNEINVRDFIQQNYTPYDGDAGRTAASGWSPMP